jgi:aminoglycoside phosphotransferase (APT) family kinase protein
MADDTAPETAQDTFSGTKPVDERYKLDEGKLEAWMKANVEGYAGPLEVRQFKGGQSNPTYQLVTPTTKYVLRRKPPGKLLPSAHAVDREFKAYALCTDDDVLGTMFYVMSNVEGRILWDGSLPGMAPAERTATYQAEIETLAALHNTDYAAIGLADFGKPGNYFARQIDRWTKQYRMSETQQIPAMERLMEYLPATVPQDDTTSIVHGDYRLDNMSLHPTEPKVIAVLDWELSTLGHPLADFTYYLMNWHAQAEGRSGLKGLDLKALGIPTVEQTVEEYCRLTGRSGLPALDWYFAYNQFRLAGILQGIVGRVRDGTASSAQAVANADRVVPLAESALEFAKRAGA